MEALPEHSDVHVIRVQLEELKVNLKGASRRGKGCTFSKSQYRNSPIIISHILITVNIIN